MFPLKQRGPFVVIVFLLSASVLADPSQGSGTGRFPEDAGVQVDGQAGNADGALRIIKRSGSTDGEPEETWWLIGPSAPVRDGFPRDLIGTWSHTNENAFLFRGRVPSDGAQPIAELWLAQRDGSGQVEIDGRTGVTTIDGTLGEQPVGSDKGKAVLSDWTWETYRDRAPWLPFWGPLNPGRKGDEAGPFLAGRISSDFGPSDVFASIRGTQVHPFLVACVSGNGGIRFSDWKDPRRRLAAFPGRRVSASPAPDGTPAPRTDIERALRGDTGVSSWTIVEAPLAELLDLAGHAIVSDSVRPEEVRLRKDADGLVFELPFRSGAHAAFDPAELVACSGNPDLAEAFASSPRATFSRYEPGAGATNGWSWLDFLEAAARSCNGTLAVEDGGVSIRVSFGSEGAKPRVAEIGRLSNFQLTNGCLGVMGPDHDFAVGPSDDTEMVLETWRRGPVAEPGL